MKRHSLLIALLSLHVAISSAQPAKSTLPEAIFTARVGMTAVDFIAARPNARFADSKVQINAGILKTGKHALLERLPEGPGFHTATYWFEDGKVIAIILAGTASRGNESKTRKLLVDDCTKHWGKGFHKALAERSDKSRPPKVFLTWDTNDVQVDLELPRNRLDGDKKPSNFSLSLRPTIVAKKFPRKEASLGQVERKAILRAHDLDE